jgi:hypothetical protein
MIEKIAETSKVELVLEEVTTTNNIHITNSRQNKNWNLWQRSQ